MMSFSLFSGKPPVSCLCRLIFYILFLRTLILMLNIMAMMSNYVIAVYVSF
jgi:hypothetical protein